MRYGSGVLGQSEADRAFFNFDLLLTLATIQAKFKQRIMYHLEVPSSQKR